MAFIKTSFISLFIISLVACGWHLRGPVDLPDRLKVVAINPDEPYNPMQHLLRSLLNASDVTVVSLNENPGVILTLLDDAVDRRALTTNPAGDVTENLLIYTITFQVVSDTGEVLLSPSTIRTERSARFDPSDLLGTAESENLILDDLRFDAVNQLIQRYANMPVNVAEDEALAEDNEQHIIDYEVIGPSASPPR